jgi:hypothetical protein
MLTLVSVIIKPVLLVMVVDNNLLGDPENVIALFVMEAQAGTGVLVGVGVDVAVGVLVGVGVDVAVFMGVGVGVGVQVGVGPDV